MNEFYIGIMSGTSLDGIDAVLVDFNNNSELKLISYVSSSFSTKLKILLLELQKSSDNEIHKMCLAENLLALEYANLVNKLLAKANILPNKIKAIGSHGQTIRHKPNKNLSESYTLQIQNSSLLAHLTNINVISNFRQADIAAGGQGAPLVPAFHANIFSNLLDIYETIIVCNIGGMSNISILNKNHVRGFDCGPGNILMDAWIKHQINLDFDTNGDWAKQGNLCNDLLNKLWQLEYFHMPAPKSTGRESFNLEWLTSNLDENNLYNISSNDVQNTLTHLTAKAISSDILKNTNSKHKNLVIVCGGGAKNLYLIQLLKDYLQTFDIKISNEYGIDLQHMESMAFAWLAHQYNLDLAGNLPVVTGANQFKVLGALFKA